MSTEMMVMIFVCMICIVGAVLAILGYRKKTRMLLDDVLQRLDSAIGGRTQEVYFDESLEGAIGDRLNRLVEISASQSKKAKEEQSTIKSLISDISHQVRTPLTNILLYAGMLKEAEQAEHAGAMAENIHRQAEKLDFFMKELVKSSYMETDMLAVSPSQSSVDELIKRGCQMVEMQALKKGILLNPEETDQCAHFDMKWTLEALGNIVENAIKYAPDKSQIWIKAVPYESFICIRVQDEGMGIREEEQGLIFQRFYRSQDAAEKKGMGIGLYLAREIVSRQSGYIKVKSKYGEGALFCIYLKGYSKQENLSNLS